MCATVCLGRYKLVCIWFWHAWIGEATPPSKQTTSLFWHGVDNYAAPDSSVQPTTLFRLVFVAPLSVSPSSVVLDGLFYFQFATKSRAHATSSTAGGSGPAVLPICTHTHIFIQNVMYRYTCASTRDSTCNYCNKAYLVLAYGYGKLQTMQNR